MNREPGSVSPLDAGPSRPATYEGRPLANPDEDIFDQGLAFDLETLLDRRRLLQLMGYAGLSAGLLALVGCAPSSGQASAATASAGAAASPTPAASATTAAYPTAAAAASATTAATASVTTGATPAATAAGGTTADCDVIPEETAGPFPGDGSNGPDVLTASGVVRQDIRSSVGEFSGTAEGVPLTIKLAIQDAASDCAALAGAAVYLWHCDREGNYSLYSPGVTDQNYLRGVQAAGADGIVTFTSIFPGCYPGRWPHIHFEVYGDLDPASDDANRIATSQVALPHDACEAAYGADGYGASVQNLKGVTLATDNVFRDDGGAKQLGAVTGNVTDGYVVELAVPVRAA